VNFVPLVRIEIIKGKSAQYRQQLLEGIHTALETALGIPGWDRYQRLYELDNDCFERDSSHSDNFTMIEITMFPGRTKEQKARVFTEIVGELERRLGIANTDVFIVLHEPPDENWGLSGRQRG